jgi:Pilus assembly protein, PilO
VTLTDRDRKIVMAIVPLLILLAYWFLLLAPKRQDASTAGEELAVQQERLDTARDKAQAAEGAKQHFEATYAQVVRLGKAIPTEVDMPSLLVQLDRAAAGTGIRFTKIKTGERTTATTATTTSTAPAGSESGTNGSPVAAGGEQAQSQPGGAAEAANNAQQTSNQASSAAESSGVNPSDTQTSTTAGATDASGQPTGTAPAGLETVPLELEFDGNFFNLATFFHRVKRFVSLANRNVLVSGRLITVEGVRWSSDEELFPALKAEIKATIYLAPQSQGTTAGATPTGPSTTTPVTTPDQTTASTPTATATP